MAYNDVGKNGRYVFSNQMAHELKDIIKMYDITSEEVNYAMEMMNIRKVKKGIYSRRMFDRIKFDPHFTNIIKNKIMERRNSMSKTHGFTKGETLTGKDIVVIDPEDLPKPERQNSCRYNPEEKYYRRRREMMDNASKELLAKDDVYYDGTRHSEFNEELSYGRYLSRLNDGIKIHIFKK